MNKPPIQDDRKNTDKYVKKKPKHEIHMEKKPRILIPEFNLLL
jgi:hypothetical protein